MKDFITPNKFGWKGNCNKCDDHQKHFDFNHCDKNHDGKDIINPIWGLFFLGGLVVGILFTRPLIGHQPCAFPNYYLPYGPY